MKLKVKQFYFTVKPKQDEGKLLVRFDQFTIKPKPHGVVIQKKRIVSVIKHDRRYGVRIQKVKNDKILKQWD